MKSVIIFFATIVVTFTGAEDDPYSLDLLSSISGLDFDATERTDALYNRPIKFNDESNLFNPLVIEEKETINGQISEKPRESNLNQQEVNRKTPDTYVPRPGPILPEVLIEETESPSALSTSAAPLTRKPPVFSLLTGSTPSPASQPTFFSFPATRAPFSSIVTSQTTSAKRLPEIKYQRPYTAITQEPTTFKLLQQPEPKLQSRISSNDQNAKVIENNYDINPDGTYKYSYQIDNGINAAAEGSLRQVNGDPSRVNLVSRGFFSWQPPTGQQVLIKYTADENGYHPEGDAIPTPPPIPPLIAEALEFLRTKNLLKLSVNK